MATWPAPICTKVPYCLARNSGSIVSTPPVWQVEDKMKALKSLIVMVLSLGLAVATYGDVQKDKADSKSDKPAQKQQNKDAKKDTKKDTKKKDTKKEDKAEKKGFKSHLKNPFMRKPKAQEADCRKSPNAPGCPDAKQAKQMAKQVSGPEPKTAKQANTAQTQMSKPESKTAKHDTVKKQASAPAKQSGKKTTQAGKTPAKKVHKDSKDQAPAKS